MGTMWTVLIWYKKTGLFGRSLWFGDREADIKRDCFIEPIVRDGLITIPGKPLEKSETGAKIDIHFPISSLDHFKIAKKTM